MKKKKRAVQRAERMRRDRSLAQEGSTTRQLPVAPRQKTMPYIEFPRQPLAGFFAHLGHFEQQLCKLLLRFLNADDEVAARLLVQEHPALLAEEAVSFLDMIGHYYRDSQQRLSILAERRQWLRDWRQVAASDDVIFDCLDNNGSIASLHADEQLQRAQRLQEAGIGYLQKEEYGLALKAIIEMFTIYNDLALEDHPEVAAAFTYWATLYANLIMRVSLQNPLWYLYMLRDAESAFNYAFVEALNALAAHYKEQLQYENARRVYEFAFRINQAMVGDKHPYTLASIEAMASLSRDLGDYDSAYAGINEALNTASFLKNTRRLSATLNVGAQIYRDVGNYSWALHLVNQALEAKESQLDHAMSLHLLALLHLDQQDYAAVLAPLQQAIAIRRDLLGEHHLDYATSLQLLALTKRTVGEFDVALSIADEVAAIYRIRVREEDPVSIANLNLIALLHQSLGNYQTAITSFTHAMTVETNSLFHLFPASSERRRSAYVQKLRIHFHRTLSAFIELQHKVTIDMAVLIVELILQRKGIEAEIAQLLHIKLTQLKNEGALQALSRARSIVSTKDLSDADYAVRTQSMPELIVDDYRRQKETWEIELALAHSDELATELRALLNSTDKMHLVSQLQKHEALIEFIQFDQFNFAAVPSRGEKEWLPARYVAVVIRNREEQPFMIVDLGEVNPINQLIVSYRNLLIQDPHSYEAVTQKEQRTISGRHLRLVETTTQEDSAQEVGIQLRRLLFDPLRVALGDCRRLLIAPDGELAVIPFEILPTDTGNFLIDTYAISYLSTGREQLRQRNNRAPVQPPLVVANPDYNLNGEDDQEVVIASPLGQQSRDLHNSQPYFFPLVGTADEGKVIAQLLDADTLFGAEAQKGTIKAIRSPQILHIATHGFFLPNQVTLAQSADGITMQIDGAETNWAKLSQIENSLLRSGLALAGANQWLAGNKLPEAAEDGLLTAEDVVSLNLTGTELVVLSACETGLGEIRLGEGVYGLRRAFALAGVNTLLMSLWKVPDLQTKELMVDFYQRLLAGESRLDALRAAQLRIKTQYPHPLYWGAFIMQGEPGPITLLGK